MTFFDNTYPSHNNMAPSYYNNTPTPRYPSNDVRRRITPDNFGFGLYSQIQNFDARYESRNDGTLETRAKPSIVTLTNDIAMITKQLERVSEDLESLRADYFSNYNESDDQCRKTNSLAQQQVDHMVKSDIQQRQSLEQERM